MKGRDRKKWKDSNRGWLSKQQKTNSKQQKTMKISGSWQEDILFSQTRKIHERQQK